ncbi:MAG: phosphonate ABC transporter substrate-binding protein [Desulfofustis sp.]|jgi:phosphonate transport system substrate-binding protein|nr:phosphonate ABC transporter substrate-binding protein [Desulfofustis sp.]
MLRKLLLTAGALLLSAGMALAEMPKQINFGIISTESSTALEAGFSPFMKDLEAYLGIEVKSFYASDYGGVIEGMRFKKVDVAWFGNKSAIEAVDRAEGEVFAQTIKDDGSEGYYSLLITHKDSGLNSLEDVLACDGERSYGAGDPNSTSGTVIPGYYVWAMHNKKPQDCFKRIVASNHEGNAIAVATGKVDVATNNTESLYARFAQAQPELAANVKEIWRSPLIPSDPMVWRKDLPQELKEKILYFFIQYGRFGDLAKIERERANLAKMSDGWGPFLASSNAQLIEVRQIELFKKKMSAQEKGDDAALQALAAEEKELKKYSEVIGKSGY